MHTIPDTIQLGTGAWQWGDRIMWGFGRGYSAADVRAWNAPTVPLARMASAETLPSVTSKPSTLRVRIEGIVHPANETALE